MLNFLSKRWDHILFLILSLTVVSFILFQEGVWLYLDNSFFLRVLYDKFIFFDEIKTFGDSSFYFGSDRSLHHSFRISNIFLTLIVSSISFLGPSISQAFSFIVLLFVFFFSARAFLKILDFEHYKIGALFYTFNPIALYLLNQSLHALVYAATPLILYSLIYIYLSKDLYWSRIILLLLGINFLLGYPRATLIYVPLILAFTVYFLIARRADIANFWKKTAIITFFVISCNLFVINNLVFLKFVDVSSTQGPTEYTASAAERYGLSAYNNNLDKSLLDVLTPQEFTKNYFSGLYQSFYYQLVSLALFCSILFLLRDTILTRWHKGLYFLVFSSFCLNVSLFYLSRYVSSDLYVKITYNIFPALQNNTSWVYLNLIFLITFFIVFALQGVKDHTRKNVLYIFVFLYIIVIVANFVFYSSNNQLANTSLEDSPKEFLETFFIPGEVVDPSIHFPTGQIITDWSRVPINVGSHSTKKNLFSSNTRLVKSQYADFNAQLQEVDDYRNLRLLNLKKIYNHTGLLNNDFNYPYYPTKDLISESSQKTLDLQNNDELYLLASTDTFDEYSFRGGSDYDFTLYSAKQIIEGSSDQFFSDLIDIMNRPVYLSRASGMPVYINENVDLIDSYLSVKTARKNSTDYYIQADVSAAGDFLAIQLNKTFNPSWKVYLSSKEEYERISCSEAYLRYSFSHNEYCKYDNNFSSFLRSSIQIFKSEKSIGYHSEGNIVGNLFLIDREDIGGDEVYLRVSYSKNNWYSFFLLGSFIIVSVLFFLSFFDEFLKRRYDV